MKSIINPKRPSGSGWMRMPDPHPRYTLGFPGEAYLHESGLYVITAVEVAEPEVGISKGPEYHVSVSMNGRRCTSADAIFVQVEFDMLGAEEDNHVPSGVVRNFWRPVADNLVGLECECKDDEPAIKEDKGDFIWRGVTG